jgi:hypothetical protein
MKKLLRALIVIVCLYACKKTNSGTTANELYGRYKGSFSRTAMDTAQVTVNFRDAGRFDGTGGPLNYPSICGGSFQRTGNSLVINDTCTWTANFDWTLIFNGNYNINFTGVNSVRIWRTNGAITDEYLLTRITR